MKLLLVIVFLVLSFSSCITKQEVDLVVHNATIYTLDEENNKFDAMAISDGIIVAIGKENQILNKYKGKENVDAEQHIIYPGFIDAHCHFLGYGLSLQQVNLIDATSFDDVIAKCKEFDKHKNPQWIMGRGWDNMKWKDTKFPTREKLDFAFPTKPVLIRRIDGHAAIANKVALDLANITTDTQVKGGHLVMKNGELTGVLVDNAVNLILDIMPKPSLSNKKEALLSAQRNCFEVGLTTVDDAGLSKSEVQLIDKLQTTRELKMRVYAMLTDSEENFAYYLDTLEEPYITDKLTVCSFKFYGDGALGSRGACLLKNYEDKTSQGSLLSDTSYFQKYAKLLYDKGFQMCTHSIGDSTTRFILKTYGDVLKTTNDRRWRIEHAQLVDSSDVKLFKKYSIVPSVQPTHAISDMNWVLLRLGKKRLRFGYAYKDLLRQNGWMPLGTDFPIEGINPLMTFYTAVARKNKEGLPKNGFQIENALSRLEALKGMTIWAALANFEETQKGSLEIGKVADFVFLNMNLLTVEENKLPKARVTATYINGEQVF